MRLRLFLSFLLIVLISVVTVVVVTRQGAAHEVRAFMLRGGMTGLEELVNSLEDYYRTYGTWQGVESFLRGPGQGHGRGMMGQGMMGGQRLRLADAQGKIVFDSALQGVGGELSAEELDNSVRLEDGFRTVGYLLPEGGMGFNRADERVLLFRLTRSAITAGLLAGGVSLLTSLLLAYTLLRPVRELTQAAESLAQGDLSQRVPVRGGDELATLAKTFNQMSASLQSAEESRRAMTADIAHELRNPLAVQRANLEALQDGIYSLTPDNLAPVLEQNHLLTRLVEDLRTLALADAGQLPLERTPTDFPALVRRVVDRFGLQAAAREIELNHESNPNIPSQPPLLSLDPLRVEQIISNLLSNALRYTPERGKVLLQISHDSRAVQLTVHDSGPGIPTEALPHVFERFYRAERSRSRSQGGSGLGLAIARQLAEAHGGTLEAANHPGGGALFTLTLPVKQII